MAQNSTAAMRVLAVPLLVAGLLLALVLVQGGRSTYSIEEITKKVLPAVVAASGMPHGGSAPAEVKSAADGKEGQQQLQAEEKIQVGANAVRITAQDQSLGSEEEQAEPFQAETCDLAGSSC